MQGYELFGSGYMGSIIPAGKKLSKDQVLNTIKKGLSGATEEVKDGLRFAYYKVGEWIRKNPKKATGIALLTSAGLVASGNAIYSAFESGDEMQKAGTLGKVDSEIEGSLMKAGTLTEKLQTEVADALSKASGGDMSGIEGGLEWWHWGLIAGGGIAAIFLVWYMFRGKKGGKRRRRR